MAIAGQQKKLAVELTVKIEAELRPSDSLFRLLPSLTVKAFSGKLVLCGFPGIDRSPDP
ncbi:hypothetical protein [Burkholderia multivorans]|uniref:hypothetical protein n=1 Tax=Burkholderia multivorans TaxID=87883 RepID=UPI001592548C|nr:hypothetical protein [Burkholderia multivorans]MBU9370435.1 hypothetical protein [Burkholderia multivorans]UXZ81262.1 hypothetical protein NUJ31_09770 [Burkholderia multivorans]HEM7810512.1 hypothetical protein [Burkholderia multivorans]HEM7816845.1 hypothetical protein [Burkholderia multivorans]HEM7822275.1 hypothetical protein [Burkholderia multivorans]